VKGLVAATQRLTAGQCWSPDRSPRIPFCHHCRRKLRLLLTTTPQAGREVLVADMKVADLIEAVSGLNFPNRTQRCLIKLDRDVPHYLLRAIKRR
jgi:hypothetical protein